MDDWQLLQAYAEQSSETAFAQLVERHLNHVYSVALRRVGDVQLAQDVTQAVFLVLARKAGALRQGTILSGWLFRTTRFTAANALRQEHRRQQRERLAMQDIEAESAPPTVWEQIAPHLDEALASLAETDRHAVLLRFFEQKSLRDVAAALRTSEDAAQKRVARAIEKLRRFFSRRGLAVSAGTVLAAISTQAVQAAPPSLAHAIVALVSVPVSAASALGLAQATMKWMLYAKVKIAAGLALPAVVVTLMLTAPWVPGGPSGQTTYDLSRDFSLTSNPSGVWAYGYVSRLDGPFTPLGFSKTIRSENGVRISVWAVSDTNLPSVARVMGNRTAISAGGDFYAPPGTVYLGAGEDGTPRNFAVIRFTVPPERGGRYRIETAVRSQYGGDLSADADFHVIRNGRELFAQGLPPNSSTAYTNTLRLRAGDTIDFAVGRGADGQQRNSGLVIQATVTAYLPPPPAPLANR
jgi:RNA polymerase sigma factor (sigma-70 family)